MFRILFALFLVLHGLVHLLYAGQSWGSFELQPGMVWPSGAWSFSRMLGDERTRTLAATLLLLAALGFVASGVGLFLRQEWWRPAALIVATYSSLLYILLWDGGWQNLDDKGAVGLLINGAIVVVVLLQGDALLAPAGG